MGTLSNKRDEWVAEFGNSRVLDLGSGCDKQPGAHGVDIEPRCGADYVLDLEKTPWPFPNDQFGVVYALQVLEHLPDRVSVMKEIYRVCYHGALVAVSVPDGFCPGYAQDPTHKSPWNIGTFLYFCPKQYPGNWDKVPYSMGVNFRVLDFHTHNTSEGKPWGGNFNNDDLRVYLQVIKSERGE